MIGRPLPAAPGRRARAAPPLELAPLRRAGAAPPLELAPLRRAAVAGASMLGPALVASVAYVDPGNVATNLQAGSADGYLLVWTVVGASAMAVLVQYLAAKLGIATGAGLAELCAQRQRPATRTAYWLQAELVAAATDLAEIVGTALGLRLLFGMPLAWAGVVAGGLAFLVLHARRYGYRRFELTIGALLVVIAAGFFYELVRAGPSASEAVGGLLPRLQGNESVLLAVGIVGATIMPHAVYVHSDLATERVAGGVASRGTLLRRERVDVGVSLGLAGLVNVAMLLAAAALFHHSGARTGSALTIEGAHAELLRIGGGFAALVFSVVLLVSGMSSAAVGTYAGQVVMRSLTGRRPPIALRRALTALPAVLLLAAGVGPTAVLVLSQAVLAFGIPFALVPLIRLTSSRATMGDHVNGRLVTLCASAVVAVVIVLDACLLVTSL